MADRRKFKYKFKMSSKFLLIALVLACFVLLFISSRFTDSTYNLRSMVSAFVSPMQNGISKFSGTIYNRMSNFSDINSLIEKNQALEDEIAQLKYEMNMLMRDNNELDEYRALFELDQKYIQYPKVAARIISRDSNNFYSTFTIDKGSSQGMQVGMNILAGNGLCGIIYEVYENTSKVRSIIDDTAALSGMFLKSSDTCMISGNLTSMLENGYIDIGMISLNADIEENSEVVTSHISDKYHQGILIGYAVKIQTDASTMTKKAFLIPAVDFEHLEKVLVITELK